MTDNNLPEESIDELVAQLQDNKQTYSQAKKNREEVTSDNLEAFIMKSSGALIEDSLDILANVKDYTAGSPDPREAQSLAELIRASSSAIDTLSKVLLQHKKSETQVQVKQMDVNAKLGLAQVDRQNSMMISREEIMKELFDDAEVIEVDDKDD